MPPGLTAGGAVSTARRTRLPAETGRLFCETKQQAGAEESVDIPHVWLEVPEAAVLEESRTMAMAPMSEHNYDVVSECGFAFSQHPRIYEHDGITVVVYDVTLLDTDPAHFAVDAEDTRHRDAYPTGAIPSPGAWLARRLLPAHPLCARREARDSCATAWPTRRRAGAGTRLPPPPPPSGASRGLLS